MICPHKPKLEARNAEDVRLYTTDDLRHLYRASERTHLIRLRDGILSRDELKAVILWRVWWESFRYFLLLVVSVVSALLALLAWLDPVSAPASTKLPQATTIQIVSTAETPLDLPDSCIHQRA
jgi:hypothetical protein